MAAGQDRHMAELSPVKTAMPSAADAEACSSARCTPPHHPPLQQNDKIQPCLACL